VTGTHAHANPVGVPAIRRAVLADLPILVTILAVALSDTDIARWLVPDQAERAVVYRRYFALVTPWFVDHGLTYVTDDGTGAALWARLDGRFEPDIADYDRRLAEACGRATARFIHLDAAMHAAHPDLPHDYLAFLAVDPESQGRGIGTALLRAHHDPSDRDALPAYLEATGRRNAALYQRHGYIPAKPFPVGDGPCLFPMVRPTPAGP
jgi:GNAT superfamily N-acetyltransferase